MINSVTVTNHLGESVTLETRFPEKSGFLIRGIDGLTPPKADINMTEVLAMDGSYYNSSRATKRNIVLSLLFHPDFDIEQTRVNSYKYFPVKRRVTLEIETDSRVCQTVGYVESNEPNIFSESEGTTISVICPSSYLTSVDNQTTYFSNTTGGFQFPFSNNSLVSKLLEFGNIVAMSQRTLVYPGDAPAGLVIYVHSIGPVVNLDIVNNLTSEIMTINTTRLAALTGSGIIAGDDIVISTVKGDKYINLIRNGVTTNIISCLEKNPAWFQIEKGDNVFSYVADSGVTNLQVRIENQILYEGV